MRHISGFVDEVEVFRGPKELLRKEPAGEVVGDVRRFYQQGRLRRAVAHRVQADADAIRRAIAAAELPDPSACTSR